MQKLNVMRVEPAIKTKSVQLFGSLVQIMEVMLARGGNSSVWNDITTRQVQLGLLQVHWGNPMHSRIHQMHNLYSTLREQQVTSYLPLELYHNFTPKDKLANLLRINTCRILQMALVGFFDRPTRSSKRLTMQIPPQNLSYYEPEEGSRNSQILYCDDSGRRLLFTANILLVMLAVNPSICLEYWSVCLAFNIPSNLLGSVGSLNSLSHSSSGNGACFCATLDAFSAVRFAFHAVTLVCSRASCLW